MLTRIPDARAIADAYLGQPYAQADCWDLVRQLWQDGFGVDLAQDQLTAAEEFIELWWYEDGGDPLPLLQPWDLCILARLDKHPIARHVGVVVGDGMAVHAREKAGGVGLERTRRWRPRLLQCARWRPLA